MNKSRIVIDTNVFISALLIVTGDSDLLVLNPFRGIEIITPEVFVTRF